MILILKIAIEKATMLNHAHVVLYMRKGRYDQ